MLNIEFIKSYMAEHKLSAWRLAVNCQLSSYVVKRWLNQPPKDITFKSLVRLCRGLKCDVKDLWIED